MQRDDDTKVIARASVASENRRAEHPQSEQRKLHLGFPFCLQGHHLWMRLREMTQMQVMNETALGTMPRSDKGVMALAPELEGPLQTVASAVAAWPGISASAHWHFYDRTRVDGVDFYLGQKELGHIHLDGSLHLATSPSLGKALVAGRLAQPFPYQRGWVCEDIYDVGAKAAIALFRSNYERLQSATA